MGWDVTTRRARLWRRPSHRRKKLWKRREVEKSERRLSHPAWKSRQLRGIPTFPQLRRRLVKLLNRTCHVLQKPDLLTCYGQACNHIPVVGSGSCRDVRPRPSKPSEAQPFLRTRASCRLFYWRYASVE